MDQQQSTATQGQPNSSANGSSSKPVSDEDKDEFFNTGRIGRRNAMPDILGQNCTASSGGDLPLKLSALTTNDGQYNKTCLLRCQNDDVI